MNPQALINSLLFALAWMQTQLEGCSADSTLEREFIAGEQERFLPRRLPRIPMFSETAVGIISRGLHVERAYVRACRDGDIDDLTIRAALHVTARIQYCYGEYRPYELGTTGHRRALSSALWPFIEGARRAADLEGGAE